MDNMPEVTVMHRKALLFVNFYRKYFSNSESY